MTGGNALVGLGTILAVQQATVAVVQRVEPTVLGVAPSLMLAAVAGAIAGVYFHQARAGKSLIPPEGEGWGLAGAVLWRIAAIGFGVLCYAYLAAVTVTAVSLWRTGTIPAVAPPITGILGCFIIPLLPAYQSALETAAQAAGNALARIFGGKP